MGEVTINQDNFADKINGSYLIVVSYSSESLMNQI